MLRPFSCHIRSGVKDLWNVLDLTTCATHNWWKAEGWTIPCKYRIDSDNVEARSLRLCPFATMVLASSPSWVTHKYHNCTFQVADEAANRSFIQTRERLPAVGAEAGSKYVDGKRMPIRTSWSTAGRNPGLCQVRQCPPSSVFHRSVNPSIRRVSCGKIRACRRVSSVLRNTPLSVRPSVRPSVCQASVDKIVTWADLHQIRNIYTSPYHIEETFWAIRLEVVCAHAWPLMGCHLQMANVWGFIHP